MLRKIFSVKKRQGASFFSFTFLYNLETFFLSTDIREILIYVIISLKIWHLQSSFFLLHSTIIDLEEVNGSIDEKDPKPTSSTWSYNMWYQSIFVWKDQGQGVLGVAPLKPNDDKGKTTEKQPPKATKKESHFTTKTNIKEIFPLRQPPYLLLCKKTLVSTATPLRLEVIPQVKEFVEGRSPKFQEPLDLSFLVLFLWASVCLLRFTLHFHGLCNFMARIPDKIKSIHGSKETLKLAVRITDLWFVGTPNKSEQAKMVFVDSESWKANLKENSTYVMHNFKVFKDAGQFRVCKHEYKLFFIGVTVVREADLHELPFKQFRFVEFSNVVVGNFVAGLLVGERNHNWCFHFDHNFFDIIGVVDQVVFRHVSSKNIRVVFRMKDLRLWLTVMDVMLFLCCSGEILSCTLWENYCMQFLSYLNERGNDRPMVIILTHARIKDVQGSYPASVSNSFKASKLLINDPILEIQEFKERCVEVSPVLLPGDQAISQVSGGSQLSSKDSFLSKAEVKTISEINGISEDVVCVTVGTISKIVMDNNSWCYLAYLQCHRKTDIQTGPFTCGCGKDNDQPVLRYRVEVMVTQNNESSKFLLWDRECAELIGQIADDVNKVKIEDGDLDLNGSPQALDKLLGHVLAFKVRIQSKFKNVVVLRYSNELDLINVVLEMLADSEACSKIDPSNVDCNNATHAESYHDLVAGFPLTPKKRMSSDEVDDELGSSQISPSQLSSNKLTRHYDKNCYCCVFMVLLKYCHIKQTIITINMQRDLILQKPGSIENVSCSRSDMLMLSHLHNRQLTTLQNMIKVKILNPHKDILILVINSSNVDIVMHKCGMMNEYQKIKFVRIQGSTYVVEMAKLNCHYYKIHPNIANDFCFMMIQLIVDKTINNSRGPPTIRIQGQPCHKIGSLLPMPGKKPKFAHLYIFVTENEVQNRINAMSEKIIHSLTIVCAVMNILNIVFSVNIMEFRAILTMATPPASPPPPLPPPPANASASPSTLKWTRKATRLRSLATRPPGAERPMVNVDPATGKADGPHKKKLRTYLGIVARDKVDVTYDTWKEVPTAQKDLIWEDIQAEFEILEASDSRTKKKIIQIVGERWRQFKSDLTRKWALGADKDGADDIVCEKYGISKEKWTQFCQTRRDPSWEDVRKKAQASQKQNTAPHVLSRGGYEYLEEKLMAEKTKKRLEEAAQSGSTEGIIDPPSPIRRHVKWKIARTKKTGQMTSEAAKEIADRIESLDEQASQGSFIPHGRQDILTAAIGRPEHPGRVRAVGAGVTIKQYFGSASRTSRSSSSMPPEDLEQLTQQIRDQLEESITEKGLALPPEPEVGPSGPRVSTKESCVAPSGNNPGTGDSDKCGLYIEENPSRLVALGRLYEGSTTVHNIPLLHGQVKVGVEEVKDAEALVPVPTDEVTLVGQALNTFLAWPTHLVKCLSEQAVVSPAKSLESLDEEVDDPLYLMTLTIPQLFLKPLQVMWDATIFGVFNQNFLLYIKHEDLSEIAHGGQCLSISVIQLWILVRAGNSDVYGFLEPQSIQRSGQSQFESESYIKSWIQSSKRDVYLGAYLNGGHWQMVVILPKENLVVWFCSLHNRPDNYLKGIINSALKGLDDTPQLKSKVAARWIVVKCNRQKGITECGYYVMHWMSTIILGSFRNNWETLEIKHRMLGNYVTLGDQANNIKLQLIAARGKYGCVYNMPNVPEIVALIAQKEILLLKFKMENYKESMNFTLSIYHYSYTMVESERLSYIRNNQKKLRVDKYSSLQSSSDTGTTKGLTKGKRVILPSTFVGSPRYMDQLYFDGMAICSHVGFPNLFITLTCNPNWPEIRRLLSPLNLKPTDRPDIVSRIFRLRYEHMLSYLTNEVQINDDTLRNLTLIEIEQPWHINQRSLKDYPTMPYPQDINLTSYLQNNLNYPSCQQQSRWNVFPIRIWRHKKNIHMENISKLNMQYPSRDPISKITEPDKMSMSPSQSPWPFKLLRRQFLIMLSYAMTINKSQGQSLSMVGLYLPKPVFTHGQLYVALSRVNSAKGLKILIHNDEQKSMNSTTNTRYPIVRPPAIIQFRAALHNDQEIPSHASKYLKEFLLPQCDNHLTILRKNAHPVQWDVVTLDRGIKDKSIVRPWYKFLNENDFHRGDEVSFYYRPHERIWEIVIRKERKWQ
ncbi:hypothetical protein HKD37_05G012846 [Glycine soja]